MAMASSFLSPRAAANSAASRTTIAWLRFFISQHLLEPLTAQIHLRSGCFLSLLHEGVEHEDPSVRAQVIKYSLDSGGIPEPQFMRAGKNVRHGPGNRKSQSHSQLQLHQRGTQLDADRLREPANDLLCPRVNQHQSHQVLLSPFRDIKSNRIKEFLLLAHSCNSWRDEKMRRTFI